MCGVKDDIVWPVQDVQYYPEVKYTCISAVHRL
jgi:hypothetical protein